MKIKNYEDIEPSNRTNFRRLERLRHKFEQMAARNRHLESEIKALYKRLKDQ